MDGTQRLPQAPGHINIVGTKGHWKIQLPFAARHEELTDVLIPLLESNNIAAIDGVKITFKTSPTTFIEQFEIYYLKIKLAKVDVNLDEFDLEEFFMGVTLPNRQQFKKKLQTNTNSKRSIVGYTMDIVRFACQAVFDVILPNKRSIRLEVTDIWDTTVPRSIDSKDLMEDDDVREKYITSRRGDGSPLQNYTEDMLEELSERVRLNGWYGMWGFQTDELNTCIYIDITHAGQENASYFPLNACMGH